MRITNINDWKATKINETLDDNKYKLKYISDHKMITHASIKSIDDIEKKLKALSNMNPLERRLQRLLLGYASECELDGNGRILLPSPLRLHAGLDKQVMLVGQLNKFEIWSEAGWLAQVEADLGSLPAADWSQSDNLRDFSL